MDLDLLVKYINVIKTQIPSTVIVHLFSNNNSDVVCHQLCPSPTRMDQVNSNTLLHRHAVAPWEDLGGLICQQHRTAATVTMQGPLDNCHLSDRFIRTTHYIPPNVQYTWGFIISCSSLHVYFYCQAQKPASCGPSYLPPAPMSSSLCGWKEAEPAELPGQGGSVSYTLRAPVCLDSQHIP